MIVGVGVDIVEVARIVRSLDRFGERFAGKILSDSELDTFRTKAQPAHWLAKRFAAKEAAAKALGTGMRAGVHFRRIVVENAGSGAPGLRFEGGAADRAAALGARHVHVSLSDEKEHAIAFVVIES